MDIEPNDRHLQHGWKDRDHRDSERELSPLSQVTEIRTAERTKVGLGLDDCDRQFSKVEKLMAWVMT